MLTCLSPISLPEIAQLARPPHPANQSCRRFKVIRLLIPALSDQTLALCPFSNPSRTALLCDSCLQYLLLLVSLSILSSVKLVLTRRNRTVFFICLRECIETSIIVSTLLAFLKQTLPTHRDASVRDKLVSQVSTMFQKPCTQKKKFFLFFKSANTISLDLVGSWAWLVDRGNHRRRYDWRLLWSWKGHLL